MIFLLASLAIQSQLCLDYPDERRAIVDDLFGIESYLKGIHLSPTEIIRKYSTFDRCLVDMQKMRNNKTVVATAKSIRTRQWTYKLKLSNADRKSVLSILVVGSKTPIIGRTNGKMVYKVSSSLGSGAK